MSWITEVACQFFTDIIGSVIEYFGELVNNIFVVTVELNNENAYVTGATNFFVLLSLGLIGLMVVKQVISGYLLETDYDSEADPFNLVVRIAQTVAIICSNAWIFDTTFSLAKSFASDVISSTEQENGITGKTQELLGVEPDQLGGLAIAFISMLLVMVIAFVVFTFVAGMRGAEVIAMKMLFPLFALDLLNARRERWNNFITGYLIAFFSYGIQMLFFNIALKSFISSSWDSPQYQIGAIVFIVLAIKAPKFLEKFLYRSGVSGAATGGMRLVLQGMVLRSGR